MSNILSKIVKVDFPDNQYYKTKTPKKQIVLHHTVSGRGVNGDVNYWLSSTSRIATHLIIDWKGVPHQCFSSSYWGHHLGVKSYIFKKLGLPSINTKLNKETISIEIDSYGGLIKDGEKWKNVYGGTISNDRVYEYPEGYRGYYAFEKYTDEQINTIKELLIFWNNRYGISLKYNENMWDVNKDALSGKGGVWSHTSYRPDKSDCHPQQELIDMLKSLDV